ncbi:DUF4430 domain-containing protein [Botrimarina mediterranea]|uniref:Transcobalamin-like C-terminal domain-containing protein n=1 Tax=Botrimarina mediterranea TaxID=2528022 RepID=A0A518K380_9BACT|nr:DUF4430 domain-containing protein [Botrimarina mediterranea]QDV72205.1 hypothetical protein Spa11_03770 [Botrimarina mediterranea]QDV76749.1 hypothetical protein K2D_03300 [Planctomycetes bacterium K2D]
MTAPASPPPAAAQPFNPRLRLALALGGVLIGLLIFQATRTPTAPPARSEPLPGQSGTVTLLFRLPDAEPTMAKIPWAEGLTVAEATAGAVDTEWQGEGAMAMLTSLRGRPNEGASGLNWQFEVNGEYATRSAGAVELRPGDSVLWKLAPYE